MSLKKVDSNTEFNSSICQILNEPFYIKRQIPLIIEAANKLFENSYTHISEIKFRRSHIKNAVNWGIRQLLCRELEKAETIKIDIISLEYFKMIRDAFDNQTNIVEYYFQPNLKLQHEGSLMLDRGEILLFTGVDFKQWRK